MRLSILTAALLLTTLPACSKSGGGGGGGGGLGGAGGGAGGEGGAGEGGGGEPSGVARLLPGEHDPILLYADLVTPDLEVPAGQVLFAQDRILCAGQGCGEGRYAEVAAQAKTVASEDRLIAFPGLIDIHNHVSWNTWNRVRLSQDCYDNRDEWRGESAYRSFRSKQGAVSGKAFCEATLYGELRVLVGGGTMTQGATLGSKDWDKYRCLDTLVRNIDEAGLNGDLGGSHVGARISRVTRMDAGDADRLKRSFDNGSERAWLVHVSEGIDEYARSEFDTLDRLGLVRPELVIIHGTAFGPDELGRMGAAGAHLVMSPISNAMYYGRIADAVGARDAGVNLSIAPDWSPSGGENMLEELRFFASHNAQVLQNAFSDEEIIEMATLAPARALKLDQQLGRLKRNYRADMMVIRSDVESPRRALLEASAAQVALVTVGGRIRYGDADLLQGVVGPECETLDVCGVAKIICVTDPGRSDDLGKDYSYAGIVGRLQEIHPDLAPLVTCDPTPPTPICQR